MEIVVKNITDNEHANELRYLINSYYDEALGPDWTKHIPIKKIRDSLYTAGIYTREDMHAIYRNQDMSVALGIYYSDDLLGFLSVKLVSPSVGGVYHIYIKPQYRTLFIKYFKSNPDAIKSLNDSIEAYFKNMKVDEIILEAPFSLEYLDELAETFGFDFEAELDDCDLFSKKINNK